MNVKFLTHHYIDLIDDIAVSNKKREIGFQQILMAMTNKVTFTDNCK